MPLRSCPRGWRATLPPLQATRTEGDGLAGRSAERRAGAGVGRRTGSGPSDAEPSGGAYQGPRPLFAFAANGSSEPPPGTAHGTSKCHTGTQGPRGGAPA